MVFVVVLGEVFFVICIFGIVKTSDFSFFSFFFWVVLLKENYIKDSLNTDYYFVLYAD